MNERKREAVSRLLLARSRGDRLVENCLETNVKLEETVASIITPSTRRQAMETSQTELWKVAEKKITEFIQRKKVLKPAQLPRIKKLF